MHPSTHYITNIQLDCGTDASIAKEIYDQFAKHGVQPPKIMGLGSDGASVMTGTYVPPGQK